MSTEQPKRPMVKIVNDIFDNYTKMVTEAVEDIQAQDKTRLRKDLNRAIQSVLDNYTVEYKPVKKIEVK
jgi:hypothetical protein